MTTLATAVLGSDEDDDDYVPEEDLAAQRAAAAEAKRTAATGSANSAELLFKGRAGSHRAGTAPAGAPAQSFVLKPVLVVQANGGCVVREHLQLQACEAECDCCVYGMAEQAVAAPQERARYHFDYVRLRADLQRVRTGLQDYLVPQRAQPRDPVPMSGDYVRRDERPEVSR